MKISIRQLRSIIQETLKRGLNEASWNVWKTKRGQRLGDPIKIDASTTDEAGKLAARQFNDGTDPYTLDVEKAEDLKSDWSDGSLQRAAEGSIVSAIRMLSILTSNITNPQAQPTVAYAEASLDSVIDELNGTILLADEHKKSLGPVFLSLMGEVGDVMGAVHNLITDITQSNDIFGLDLAINDVLDDLRKIRDTLVDGNWT